MQKLISKIKKAILARIKEYNVRKHVISEIKSNPTPEKNEVLQYLKHFKRFSYDLYFPYSWGKEYNYKAVKLLHDEDGYPYVFHRGHKLFFQKKWSDTYCKKYYNWLLLEQDHRSPHVYIKDVDRLPSSNDVVADIGAAEGIFALNVFSSITPPPRGISLRMRSRVERTIEENVYALER